MRRLEKVSGIPHRPASSYEDTITANADNHGDGRVNAAAALDLGSGSADLHDVT